MDRDGGRAFSLTCGDEKMFCASTCSAEVMSKPRVQCHLLLSRGNDWTGKSDLSFLRSSVRALKAGQFTGWSVQPQYP